MTYLSDTLKKVPILSLSLFFFLWKHLNVNCGKVSKSQGFYSWSRFQGESSCNEGCQPWSICGIHPPWSWGGWGASQAGDGNLGFIDIVQLHLLKSPLLCNVHSMQSMKMTDSLHFATRLWLRSVRSNNAGEGNLGMRSSGGWWRCCLARSGLEGYYLMCSECCDNLGYSRVKIWDGDDAVWLAQVRREGDYISILTPKAWEGQSW